MKLSKNAYSVEFNRVVERENFQIPLKKVIKYII